MVGIYARIKFKDKDGISKTVWRVRGRSREILLNELISGLKYETGTKLLTRS
jgi:hypothetical protein